MTTMTNKKIPLNENKLCPLVGQRTKHSTVINTTSLPDYSSQLIESGHREKPPC